MQINDLSKLESRIKDIETETNKLLEENVKDVKTLKAFLSELETTKEGLLKRIKDIILANMPDFKKYKKNKDRLDVIEGYEKIIKNHDGINKFYDINMILYVLENPMDLDEFNTKLTELIDLINSYGIETNASRFGICPTVSEYMNTFFEKRKVNDFLIIMKEEFDRLYWVNHDLLSDICLNFRMNLFERIDYLLKYFKSIREEYVKKNNIDEKEVFEEKCKLVKEDIDNENTDPVLILERIKNGQIDSESLSEDGSSYMSAITFFVTEEYYNNCDRDTFISNIINLRYNLSEYKYYEEYKYLVSAILEISEKKDEYKSLYSTKKTNIKKLNTERIKILNEFNKLKKEKYKIIDKKESLFFSSSSKQNKIDKLSAKLNEIELKLNENIDSIREEFKEFDLSLFREKSSIQINSGYTIYDDLLLFKDNVFVLKSIIKDNNSDLSTSEIDEVFTKFNNLIKSSNVQIINALNFKKEESIEQIIMNKYKLIDINFELSMDTVDSLLDVCNTIINAFYVKKSGLDPLLIKMIEKYIMAK